MVSTVACAAPGDDGESTEAAVSLSDLKVRFGDAKKLDLTNLSRIAVGFAAEELKDALEGNGWSAPKVFAAQAEPSSVLPNRLEVKSLDRIVTGLAGELGESELPTRVMAVRLAHLKKGQDKYFVESDFTGQLKVDRDVTVGAEGFSDTQVRLGIDVARGIKSRVVLASDDQKIGDITSAMGTAAKSLRGFVNPRTLEDIAKMKPGEAFGFKSFGRLGGNLNLGVPLLVADPSTLVFRVVASAGVAGVVSGEIDVEIVKISDDEFVVDFGVEKANGWTLQAGINDEWGIKGLCESPDGSKFRCLDVMRFDSGKTVDLRKIAEKAVARELNKFNTIAINASTGKENQRLTVSRFHFHPKRGNKAEVEKAFQQAVYNFDMRYAQALAARDLGESNAGIEKPFDAVRWVSTAKRNFGAELFGIDIFHKAVVEKTVSFSIDTPTARKTILADVVHTDRSGVFVNDWRFARTAVAAQTVDLRDPDIFKSEANLFLQGAIGDPHMTDDVIIDSHDATLFAIGGPKLVETLDEFGNQMSRLVWSTCPTVETQRSGGPRNNRPPTRVVDEQCNVRLLDNPEMTRLKTAGLQAIEPVIAEMSPQYQALAREAAKNRLSLQSVGIHNSDGNRGPTASFTFDARLDEAALAAVMSRSKADYQAAVNNYATFMRGNRSAEDAVLDRQVIAREVDDKWAEDIAKMADTFERHAVLYRDHLAVERLLPQALAGIRFLAQPLGVTYDKKDNVSDIESPQITTLAQRRSEEIQALFDDLQNDAKGLTRRQALIFKRHDALSPAHAAAFPLIALAPRSNVQLAFSLRADSKSDFWTGPARYQKAGFKNVDAKATGDRVSLISAEMFDLDRVLGLRR